MKTRAKRAKPISDELCPDFSECENCNQKIGWDDWSYVHMNGWATCETRIEGGLEIAPGIVVDPVVISSSSMCAEPKEWYEDFECGFFMIPSFELPEPWRWKHDDYGHKWMIGMWDNWYNERSFFPEAFFTDEFLRWATQSADGVIEYMKRFGA